MATTTANLNINATQATQTLTKVQRQVDTLSRSFQSLGRLVGGLALGGFITNMLRSADAMSDLSAATGLTIATINGLSSAFLANGADADTAQTAILKFNDSITEAAQGSDKTIETFQKLGISLQDIGSLSEEDLLRRTIQALGEMEPGAKRTSTALDLFGKAARTVDFTGVNNQLDSFIDKSKEAEPGIKRAAALFDNLQGVGKQFGTELAKEFEGVIKVFEELTANTKQIAEDLAKLTKIVAIFGAAWLIFGKILPAINAITGAIASLGAGMGIFSLITKNAKRVLVDFVAIFKSGIIKGQAIKDLTVFGQKIANVKGGLLAFINMFANLFRILFRFAGITAVLIGVAQAIDFVVEKLTGFSILDWLGEKLSYVGEKFKQLLKFLGFTFDTAPLDEAANAVENVGDAAEATGQDLSKIAEENQKFMQSVRDVTKAYREQNAETLQALTNQMRFLHMTDQEIAMEEQRITLTKQLNDTLDKLNEKRREAMTDPSKGAAVVDQIDREIIAVRNSAAAAQEASKIKTQAYFTELNMIELRNKALQESFVQMDNTLAIEQLKQQVALIGLYGDELENNSKILEVTTELQNKLTEYTKQLATLENQRKENRIGEQEYQREVNHLQNLINLAYEYAGARVDAEQQILNAQRATQENAKLGTEQAIADIAKQFTPYQMAQDAINIGWQNISNSIDKFIETGKMNFSDFARSVIQDLTKMIAKALVFEAIKTGLKAFGLTLPPGLASGGPAKMGQPYIVGEKGPELFVPNQSGTVVPNNKLSQGSGTVSAPVTNIYNSYNISALDSKSVAQMFAENRKSLLGSVQMAQKELPYGMG